MNGCERPPRLAAGPGLAASSAVQSAKIEGENKKGAPKVQSAC